MRSSSPKSTAAAVALAVALSIFCSICDLAHAAECTTQQENTIASLNRNNAQSSACREYASLSPSSTLFARICRDKSCVAVIRANIAKYPTCSVNGVDLKQALTLAWKECDRYSSLTSTPTPTTKKPTTSTTKKPTTPTPTTKKPSSTTSSSTATRTPTPTTTTSSSLRTVTPTISNISSINTPLIQSGASMSVQSVSAAALVSSLFALVMAYAATS